MLTQGRLAEIIKLLMMRMGDDERLQAPGVVISGAGGAIDDGNYGDPARDDRPEMVRADNEGWVNLQPPKRQERQEG